MEPDVSQVGLAARVRRKCPVFTRFQGSHLWILHVQWWRAKSTVFSVESLVLDLPVGEPREVAKMRKRPPVSHSLYVPPKPLLLSASAEALHTRERPPDAANWAQEGSIPPFVPSTVHDQGRQCALSMELDRIATDGVRLVVLGLALVV